jgi:formyltetrahydrofolate-dependent phosphoribosylglycinamide formyltransferase
LKARVAVLISGAGTNMAALVYAAKQADCQYEVVLVASNDPAAAGLTLARAEGIATYAHSHKGLDRAAFDTLIDAQLREARADYVALAGYMRLLSPEFVERWAGRMLNIHPSLLPKYKGLDTYARAIAAGDSHAGCSVHVVTPALDDGPVLAQTAVAILPDDTPGTLAARIRIAEHQLYSRTLAAYVGRERDPAFLLDKVRAIALAQAEAEETLSHGMPCFGIVKAKKFAWFTADHHGDGRIALLVKISGAEEQAMLIERDDARYFRPAYFGDGWIGIRLDLGDTDWEAIADWVARSWRSVAPKRLTRLIDAADAF